MPDKPTALVTGANKGIGLQIAKDLAGEGFTVLVGSRNLENGQQAATSVGDGARAVQLDVTDQASISAAAEYIRSEFGQLDVLVNNAGISHAGNAGDLSKPLAERAQAGLLPVAPLDDVRTVFETNVFGVIAVTQAMLPLLRKAPQPRIVNVASSGGSMTLTGRCLAPIRFPSPRCTPSHSLSPRAWNPRASR
jgi:NAD(P)-dependent dehydrogenase (short-subunit alcohol dehydrogenase family)